MNWNRFWKIAWYFLSGDSRVVPVPDPIKPKPEPPKPDPPKTEMVLFDLPQTAIDLNSAGFPGREGIVLYALGQVANGWPIPGQGEELITIAGYYNEIGQWYESRIYETEKKLKENLGLSVIIIAGDQKDRFGCRIGPPTYERLKAFGARVRLGVVVSESEY